MPSQNNVENLLDIDFDGSAPASTQKENPPISSGPEGQNGASKQTIAPSAVSNQPANNLDDLMDVFGTNTAGQDNFVANHMADSLADLNVGSTQSNLQVESKKDKDNIMDLI